jgi:iron complex transport system substrate-binding protein
VLTPPRAAPITAAIDRRRFLGAAGLATLLGLTACGAEQEPVAARPATRTFEGAFGPVDVPVAPQRVVSTDFYTAYALLDVGYTVAATVQATTGGVLPEYRATYEALPKIGAAQDVDFERVVAARPDLILGTLVPGLPGDLAERLSGIAPTLLFPAAGEPGTWGDRAVRAADVVGRRTEADALRTAYETRAADIGARHRDVLARTRWALVRGGAQGNALVDLPNSWSGVVLGAVGAQFGSVAAGKPGASTPLSFEQLGLLDDCDVVLHLVDTAGGVDANTQRVLDQPTFRALRAAREGRVYPLPNYYVAHYRQGDAVLTEIEGVLEKL